MKNRKTKILILIVITIISIGSISGCSKNNKENKLNTEEQVELKRNGEFKSFIGEDLNGNKIDETILKDNKITVLNFWFNGCTACVSEMPALENLNKKLKEKDCELIGVNTEYEDGEKVVEEAKKIIEKQGATYKNIMIKEGNKALKYIDEILAYPTTIFVDSDGNIIGEPICGNVDNDETINKILKTVDNISKKY